MKYNKLLPLIALFSILIVSCGKKSNLGKLIPKDASMVIDINSKSLLSKVSWEEIKKTYWYNEVMSDTSIPAKLKVLLEDPSKSGINLESDMVCFLLKHDTNDHFVIEGNLKDNKLFSDHLKIMHPEATFTKEGDLNILKTAEAVMGWNDERFVMVADANHFKGKMNDDSTQAEPLPTPRSDDMAKVCKNLFALSNDNSMYDNERFAKLTEEEGDIHFWININEMYKSSVNGMQGMAGMIKLDKFLVDNITALTVNFQDGKITVNHKQYYGKELSDIVKKGEGNVNTDMIKRLPSQNTAGVLSFHITPANLLEVIKLTGLDGFINLFMAQQGLSLEDAAKATKGDMVFSVSDIAMKKDTLNVKGLNDTMTNKYHTPDATFLLAVAIGDKDAFNKLLGMTNKMGKEEAMKNFAKKSDDKYFVIGNSQDAVNKFFTGIPSNPDYLSKISDHPVGGYIDIQTILKALQTEFSKDSMEKIYYNRNIAIWNNLYFTGGEFKDGGIVTHAEINLVDKNTNSLKQLNQYIDDNARLIIEKKKKEKAEWKNDSIPKVKTDSTRGSKNKLHGKTRK